jgi:hypothetical protein
LRRASSTIHQFSGERAKRLCYCLLFLVRCLPAPFFCVFAPRANAVNGASSSPYLRTRSWLGLCGVENDAARDPNCQPGHATYACGLNRYGLQFPPRLPEITIAGGGAVRAMMRRWVLCARRADAAITIIRDPVYGISRTNRCVLAYDHLEATLLAGTRQRVIP